MDIEPKVTADEMIQELQSIISQQVTQIAAMQILIRKLTDGASSATNGVSSGQAHVQEEEQSLNGKLRNSQPAQVPDP